MRARHLIGVLALAVAAPSSAQAADPIMPLSEVRAGMRCTGLTVVRGTTISRFEVEVMDVVTGTPGQAGPRILVRVSGPAVDSTGVGEGFSGSPVLCPDSEGNARNAGAISEAVGEYGNRVALATPIEEMLAEPAEPPAGARSRPGVLSRARPLAAPLTAAGLLPDVRRRFVAAGRKAGRRVLAAPAGPLASFPPQELIPGASVAAGLAGGDIALGAVGTVAYRDGDRVWAFGHPIDGVGRRSLFLQDAYVFGVIGNPLGLEGASTYKLATPGHTLGAVTNDALAAAVGRLGQAPPGVRLRVSGRDLDTGRTSFTSAEVSDEHQLDLPPALDVAGSLALGQTASALLRSLPPRVTTSLCVAFRARERSRPFRFCNRHFDGAGPFLDFTRAVELVDRYEFGPLHLTEAAVRLRMSRGVREAFLLRATGPRRVRRGQRARIGLVLRERRGGNRRLSFRLRIPRSLRPGRRVLRLTGEQPSSLGVGLEEVLTISLEAEEGEEDEEEPPVRSLGELARQIAAIHRPRGLRGTFRRRGRGPIVLRTGSLLIRGKARLALRVAR